MPKHRRKKTANTTEPYNQATNEVSEQTPTLDTEKISGDTENEELYCDKCTESVDQLIQC